MATIIRLKRSTTNGDPDVLATGELAYSALPNDDINGGDRLYIGMGPETNGDAANHYVIGGKYFTDMLDHVRGQLTASSALVVDANKKINEFNVDFLRFDGNTISHTGTSNAITINPNSVGSNNGFVSVLGNISTTKSVIGSGPSNSAIDGFLIDAGSY